MLHIPLLWTNNFKSNAVNYMYILIIQSYITCFHLFLIYLPFEKKTLTAKQNEMVAMAYNIRNTNTRKGLV